MHNDPPLIQCPNYFCQTQNPESYRFCSNCQTVLPKRFLWMVGADTVRQNGLVGDRYLVKAENIALDTKPGSAPEMPRDILPNMEPYLRLISYRLHLPQLYAVVQNRVLLLDSAPIYPEGARSAKGENLAGRLMPSVTDVWQKSSALRQLNLLWQWAQLWQPLSSEQVALTLLDVSRLRVDGGTLKLTDLVFDRAKLPTLIDLGQLWSQFQAQPEISEFFNQLCQNLIDGRIASADQLVEALDQGLTACGKNQTRSIRFATFTDQGPSRQSNEDECYPPSGSNLTAAQSLPLVIVCDGIGGHEGGEVASRLAIQSIANHAQLIPPEQSAAIVSDTLAEAIFGANDVISQRNDAEQRQERQRMGTTVVMGLAHAHELYIAHVGDSRAYRITRTGCYQVTLDDDVASREVRLGYTLYREALQRPAAGSLVQALGMGSSNYLYPNIQRFVLDEDSVYLLCSDGLSDHDRVEEVWETDITPILDGKLDVATAARKLVEIANTRNGHDNVTVGVIHCQVKESAKMARAVAAPTQISPPATTLQTTLSAPKTTSEPAPASTELKTQLVKPRKNWVAIALSLIALLGLGGILAFLFVPEIRNQVVTAPIEPSPSPSEVPAVPTIPPVTKLTQGAIVRTNSPLVLFAKPELGTPPQTPVATIPANAIVQIDNTRQAEPDRPVWVRVKLCSVEPPPNAASPLATPAVIREGWQQEQELLPNVTSVSNLQPSQLGSCLPPNPSGNSQDNTN